MIREATPEDIPELNKILNAPGVIEGATMDTCAHMDAGVVLDMGGVVLTNGVGGFLLIPTEPEEYEAHMFFLPEGRGKHAIKAAKEGLGIMFDKYKARKITARIPLSNIASRRLTKQIGFNSVGTGPSDYGVGIFESEFYEVTECPR